MRSMRNVCTLLEKQFNRDSCRSLCSSFIAAKNLSKLGRAVDGGGQPSADDAAGLRARGRHPFLGRTATFAAAQVVAAQAAFSQTGQPSVHVWRKWNYPLGCF